MLKEAVRIMNLASMNSKSERSSYKIAIIRIKPIEMESKMELGEQDKMTKCEEAGIITIKAKSLEPPLPLMFLITKKEG